ncbi:MAG: LysR family transcriptional regulator [Coriobacteriales bacterium]
MNTSQIEYFLDIAATGNMSRSAERLHVAQPALSRSIAKLEEELGARLFERGGRGMRLTEEGLLLQERLAPLMDALRETEELFGQLKEDRLSELRVTVNAGSLVASQALAEWMAGNGLARVTLTQLAEGGAAPRADVEVSSEPPSGAAQQQRFTERVMLAAPTGAGLGPGPVAFPRLRELGFIAMPSGTGFSRHVAELCRRQGFEPRIALESDNPDVVRRMIGLGLGVGFWPERSWGPLEAEGVQLLPLECGDTRSIWVSLTEQGAPKALAVSFYRHLCRCFSEAFKA